MEAFKEINFGEINEDWQKKKVSFVNRGEKSSKIYDFSTKISTNELMRFEVVDSLNFELPKINESVFFLTTKQLSLLDVLNYIEKKREGGGVDEAYIYLFTLNSKAANYIISLSKRCKVNLLISDIMNSKREKERVITKTLEKGLDFVFCHSHAKIISVKTKDEKYYNLVGSMNAGSNAKIENLQIINSKKMYNFVADNYKEMKLKYSITPRY